MTIEEMRQKTDEELKAELKTTTESLFKLRFRKVTDVIEDPTQIKVFKKNIARVHTLLRERAMKKAKEAAAAKKAAPAPAPPASAKK